MMVNVWFTSDLHLGHRLSAELRGFNSVEEHDDTLIYNMATLMNKKSKLFILGDVTGHHRYLPRLAEIPGTKELIIGNHDALSAREYLKYFNKIHGFRTYKGFWLSHPPIHPQEMRFRIGNIHGHIHKNGATGPLPLPYYNVNTDFHNFNPVNFDTIREAYGQTS